MPDELRDGIPVVDDYKAVGVKFAGRSLELFLRRPGYARQSEGEEGADLAILRFDDVDSINARPPVEVARRYRFGRIERLLWPLWRRLGNPDDTMKSARDLVAQVETQGDLGEPLHFLEPVAGGFVLATHVGGYYYIRSGAVRWSGKIRERDPADQ